MKILLTGRGGQVGSQLEVALAELGEVLPTGREQLDLADAEAIRTVVRQAAPQLIVNAAAYTSVDGAESQEALAMAINGHAPGILAEEAERVGAVVVHYSTDYVFDGAKRTPYEEDDAPRPLNAYGRTKLEGERRLMAATNRYLLVRTSWVYGPSGRNFYRAIAARARAGEALRVVNDQRGVPTTGRFIAQCTVELLRARATGLCHVVPGGDTTWHEFAEAIVAHMGLRMPVEAIPTSAFPSPARRPPYSVLDNRRLAGLVGHALPHWRELLATIIPA